jgi:ParB-like nuclease domain
MNEQTKVKAAVQITGLGNAERRQLRGLTERNVWRPIDELRPFSGNPRRHPDVQIAALAKTIQRVWTNPILIDETATILAGHGRLEAARRLGMTDVPTVMLNGLSPSEKRAVVIPDNRLPERVVWDLDLLRGHFQDLVELDFDVELTGFSTGEVDLVIDGKSTPSAIDPADDLSGFTLVDLQSCGDAVSRGSYDRVLQGEFAQMVVIRSAFSHIPVAFPAIVPRNDIWPEGIRAWPF